MDNPSEDPRMTGERRSEAPRRLNERAASTVVESRWPVFIALVAAMILQWVIPRQYTPLAPRFALLLLEALLLVLVTIINPLRLTRSTRFSKAASKILLLAITLDNGASAVALNYHILNLHFSDNAAVLLGSGAAIFLTNIIVFGIWYWEMDLGGPFGRAGIDSHELESRYPDFMFPQIDHPELAPAGWEPQFLDYLYVSFTNVVAFSPTDTMPLTRRAKGMMALQSAIAYTTLALVIARAVNVLK